MYERLIITEGETSKIELKSSDLPPAKSPVWDSDLSFFIGEPWLKMQEQSYLFKVPDRPYVFLGILETVDKSGHIRRKSSNDPLETKTIVRVA